MVQADPLAPGLRLGRYELIQRLAVGGMAEIYLARATGIEGFEKLVVLKRILPQFAGNESFVTMFLDEARLSATLQHPNIAQVHDIGQYGSSYFFTMEYVRGQDVRAILKTAVQQNQRIPLAHSLKIIIDACAGLHAAHEKCDLDGKPLNIVHRDVSPSNVVVSYDGSVKLLDFGVAKATQRQAETRSGTLKGKVSYMSPEQCRGRALDRRSDVFALGILLYELTLRRRLFKGDSEFEIMTKIVKHDVEPPSLRFPKYPKQLELILLRALKRDRQERYASAQELQVDLEDFATRNRLQLSNVRLGKFMSEMFVDRMREIDSAITRRPRTEELEDAAAESTGGSRANDDSGSYPDVVIETGDRNVTSIGSGLAKRRGTGASAALSSASLPAGTAEAAAGEISGAKWSVEGGVIGGGPVPKPEISGAKRSGEGRRQWPMMLLAAAVAAAAVFVYMSHDGEAERPVEPAATSSNAKPVIPALTRTKKRIAPAARRLAAPARLSAPSTAASVTPIDSTAGAPAIQPVSLPPAGATLQKATTASKPPHAKPRSRVRRWRRARSSAKKKPSVVKGPSAQKKSWQLDSPLPPPSRSPQ